MATPPIRADEAASNVTTLVTGRIWTADPNQPWAEAVAIRGDRIVAVGSQDEVARLAGADAEVIDAGGGLVVPGLIDSHIHLIEGGLHLTSVQLRDADSRDEFVRRIGEFAKKLKPGEWITGGDWDHTLWGGELPSRDGSTRSRPTIPSGFPASTATCPWPTRRRSAPRALTTTSPTLPAGRSCATPRAARRACSRTTRCRSSGGPNRARRLRSACPRSSRPLTTSPPAA